MKTSRPIFLAAAVFLLLAFPYSAPAATHIVNQVDSTFSPNDMTITAGDVVEWHWSSGIHTVTSGTGPTDPVVGQLFDHALDSTNTVFTHTFGAVGDFPYFCRVHFAFGMTGVIRVRPPTATEEATWGRVKALFQ